MTLRRAPLSIDAALARIAGQLPGDWARMAELTNYQERTVRKWGAFEAASDEGEARDIPMRAAIALDIEYRRLGGTGAPIFEAYGLLVEAADADAFACQQELHRETIAFMRENSEAETALLELTQPGAGPLEEAKAQAEVLHVVQKGQEILTRLGRKPP
ncbi:MAG: hypothetical protein CMO29_02075 [Tistrella sp.]|nr:hypothetical protein [Tistrella sp.]|tara:strand:- start:3196 stop:3672 length:477 start_codon:yes stop_codon:yes gene_type:complete